MTETISEATVKREVGALGKSTSYTRHVNNKEIEKQTSRAVQLALFNGIRKSETSNLEELQKALALVYVEYKQHYDNICGKIATMTPEDLQPHMDIDLYTIRTSQYKVVTNAAESESKHILRTMASFLDLLEREGRTITRMVELNKTSNAANNNDTKQEVSED